MCQPRHILRIFLDLRILQPILLINLILIKKEKCIEKLVFICSSKELLGVSTELQIWQQQWDLDINVYTANIFLLTLWLYKQRCVERQHHLCVTCYIGRGKVNLHLSLHHLWMKCLNLVEQIDWQANNEWFYPISLWYVV